LAGPEAVFAELEILFSQPPVMLLKLDRSLAGMPESGAIVVAEAIVNVGALLQAAAMVARLRSTAGEPDAPGHRGGGDFPAPGVGDAAGGPADRRAAAVALLALLAARAAVGPAGSGAADDLIFGIAKMDETK
jgi:hypothetical protein